MKRDPGGPSCLLVVLAHTAGIRPKRKTFSYGIQLVLKDPVVRGKKPVTLEIVPAFDDATHLYLRQGETLNQDLDTSALEKNFVERLPVKIHNRSIRAYGPGLQIIQRNQWANLNFHVGVFFSIFLQDLDPLVNKLRFSIVVNVVGVVEQYGRSARV